MSSSRRQFLRGMGLAASGLWLPGCAEHTVNLVTHDGQARNPAGTGGNTRTEQSLQERRARRDDVLLGLYSRDVVADAQHAVRDLCSHLDWSWLSRGDTVFVKLACNSSLPHPAATSPSAVRAVVSELRDRGAGRVLVGDQSGVGYVRLAEGDRRFRSTREMAQRNGLFDPIVEAGGIPYFFDEHTFEDGYVEATPPEGSHWREPLRIARIAREVDHIIYMPRLSSHVIAGYTHGHKLAIGWLRDECRFHLHYHAADYHRKFVEISYTQEIRSRFRLVITLSEQMILGEGPHHGTPGHTDSWIALGSSHLANHDAVSVAVLAYVDEHTPSRLHIFPPPYGPLSNLSNWEYVSLIVPKKTGIPWGIPDPLHYQTLPVHAYKKGIAHDFTLRRAYDIIGGIPDQISVRLLGQMPDPQFTRFLTNHNEGRLNLL